MSYQRKTFLRKVPKRTYEIIEDTCERIFHGDPCGFIMTRQNREFLAYLEREHRVSRKAIAKIIRDTFNHNAIVTEIFLATGGHELEFQGKKLVAGYSRAITALEKLLDDESLDRGFKGYRPGRRLRARECIREDIDYLSVKRREWATLYHVYRDWPLWAVSRPVMTTMLKHQAATLHRYIADCVRRTVKERRSDFEQHGCGVAINGLVSELLIGIYRHRAFNGERRLSSMAIKWMVENAAEERTKRKLK